jgi:hypothetical protein
MSTLAPPSPQNPSTTPPGSAGIDAKAVAQELTQAAKPGCPQCGSTEPWGLASWCPRCGYYPALGKQVGPLPPAVDESEATAAPPLWTLVPRWGWILGAGVVAIIAVSIVGRLCTPDDSWARTYWALGQIVVGLVTCCVAHAWSYMVAITKTDRFGVFDIFLKPGAIWGTTLQRLPQTVRQLWLGSWGLSAVLFAMIVVGGLRYSAIFDDWGFKKTAAPNLVKAVSEKAQAHKGNATSDSMEGAIKDFTGEADVDNLAKKVEPKPVPAPVEKRETLDCLIIGYTQAEGSATFSHLLLASLVNGKLKFVGLVSQGLSDETRTELHQQLITLRRETPFVRCNFSGKWVQPALMCRVSYKSWPTGGRLQEARFEAQLAGR